MSDPFLPPIMQTPGLHLVSIGERNGRSYLKFSTAGRNAGVREVVVFLDAIGPLSYVYTTYDNSTRTIVHHAGSHGDPDKDKVVGDITAYF